MPHPTRWLGGSRVEAPGQSRGRVQPAVHVLVMAALQPAEPGQASTCPHLGRAASVQPRGAQLVPQGALPCRGAPSVQGVRLGLDAELAPGLRQQSARCQLAACGDGRMSVSTVSDTAGPAETSRPQPRGAAESEWLHRVHCLAHARSVPSRLYNAWATGAAGVQRRSMQAPAITEPGGWSGPSPLHGGC